VSPATVKSGDLITYTFTVTNKQKEAITGFDLKDEFTSIIGQGWAYLLDVDKLLILENNQNIV
jgi:hypothetical protein